MQKYNAHIDLYKIVNILFLIIIGFFIGSFTYKIVGVGDLDYFWNLLYHSDFYINYQGGFVRRGLDGEVIYQLSKALDFYPTTLQKSYNLFFFVAFVAISIYFFIRYKPVYYVYFSMSLFLLFLYYLDRGLRKDHIILLFFIASIILARNRTINTTNKIILLNLTLIIGSLLHEVLFLISFFPILITLMSTEKLNISTLIRNAFYLLPATLVFVGLTTVFPGNLVQEKQILESWTYFSINDIVFNQGIFNKPLLFNDLGLTLNQVLIFLGMVFMHFSFIVIPLYNVMPSKQTQNILLILAILQYLVIILLSYFAIDYSRWIFMGNFTIVYTIYLLKDKIQAKSTPANHLKNLRWLPFVLFFVITMPHSGWSGMDGILKHNPVVLIKKIYCTTK